MLRSTPPVRPLVVGGIVAFGALILLGLRVYPVVAIGLLLGAGWICVSGILNSTVQFKDSGISFVTLRGRQHWAWPDITEAHLSGTGTIPGIAVYKGRAHLRFDVSQFPDLRLAARLIEQHVSPEAVRSTWDRV